MDPHIDAAIALHSVSAGYGRRVVLHEVTTRVPRARVTAVMGANGSGKSTLLGVLAGVLPHTSGVVECSHNCRPALVVQRSAASDTLPITVRETVSMGRWAHRGPWRRLTRHDREIVDDCLERMGIGDLAPRQLGSLSGGQRQRALLAQGLAQESDLLLLDEPATGLDAAAQERTMAVLVEAQAGGTTVVHATHNTEAASYADHCLLLDAGRLLAEGTPGGVLDATPS